MNLINSLVTNVFQGLLFPLAAWPLLALFIVSALCGLLMTSVYRWVSNQTALGLVVDRSRGHLLAIKLFKDDLRGMFGSLLAVLKLAAARLWYSVVPMLVMAVPLLLVLVQLALRFEHRPLRAGEAAIVELELSSDAWDSLSNARLEPLSSVEIETPAVRDVQQHTIAWRVRPKEEGDYRLRWQLGPAVVEKQLIVRDHDLLCAVSARRAGQKWWDRILNPGEPSFGMFSSVAGASVRYPARETPVLGWPLPWWFTFVGISIAAALAMQPILKVKF